MKKEKKSLNDVFDMIVNQMDRVSKATDTEREEEISVLEGLAKGGAIAANAAEVYVKMFIAKGVLPSNNPLFTDGDKLLTSELIDSGLPKLKTKGLLVDEFTRGAVKQ